MKKQLIKRLFTLIGLIFVGLIVASCGEEILEPTTYTVTFNTQEGTTIDPQTIEENALAVEPDAPMKEGYQFLYWYLEGEETAFSFSTLIIEDIILFAKWDIADDVKLDEDIDQISIPETTTETLTLPSSGENGSSFTWLTRDTDYLNPDTGEITQPSYGEEDVIVALELVATLNSETKSIIFEILIPAKDTLTLTSQTNYPFTNLATEYTVKNGRMMMYFFNNEKLPYVDLLTFITFLDGAIESVIDEPREITGDDGEQYMAVYYMEVHEHVSGVVTVQSIHEYTQDGTIAEKNVYEAIFDFNTNTYYSENFDFIDSLAAQTETDFGEGLSFGETFEEEGAGISIDFNHYDMYLILHDGENENQHLMPVYLANLMFLSSVYYDVYFNGDKLYGVDSFQLLSGDDDLLDQLTDSSLKGQPIPKELSKFTYNYLALAFDYFYGLKYAFEEDSFYEVFGQYKNDMLTGTTTQHYRSIFRLTYGLDDLHTYHITSGFYLRGPKIVLTSMSELGTRTQAYYDDSSNIRNLINGSFGGTKPQFWATPDEKTLIIPIDSFTVDTPNEFRDAIEAGKIAYPNIENIVVDLTSNGGGNVGAVWRTLGYMTDETILYHSQNPTDGSTVTYEIFSEYVAYPYEWYIMTSGVTFSAANLMAATAQELGIATIIGSKSGGGASSITSVILPTGSVLFMSSNNVISTKDAEGVYHSVEYGVEPDIVFLGRSRYYQGSYIQEMIEN